MIDLDAPFTADVVGQARHLYIAVRTTDGPLVTPELYAVADGRLWCLTARGTAKARLTADGDRVGAAVVAPGRAVALTGSVERFDPGALGALVSKLGELPSAASAVGAVAARNGHELSGFVRDAVAGRLGRPLPAARMLLAVRPTASAVVTGVADVAEVQGSWPSRTGPTHEAGAASAGTVPDVPPAASVVVGWTAGEQPLALPAEWRGDGGVAVVSGALFDLTGASAESRACLCFDVWSGTGPTGKQGTVVRGGGVAERDGDVVRIAVTAERVTTWNGVETSSRRAGAGET